MKTTKYLIFTIGEAILITTFLILFFSLKAKADVTPAKIFSSGMVLQREVPIPVWGTGTSDETITISLNGQSKSGTCNNNGQWKIILEAMQAGGPYEMTIQAGSTSKNYTDVYIGDVWLASGQSNMELTVSQANDATAQIAAANSQLIREFRIPKSTATEASDIIPSGSTWKPAIKSNVGNFSAVAYYFAKNIQPEIDVPIGIINNSYGGSRIEAWMSDDMLGFDEEVVLAGGTYIERQPTVLFNKMLNPIIGYPVKGFLWYQGESNADNMEDAKEYGSLFKTMITSWRELWGMGDLPFLWIQLPNQGEISTDAGGWDAWPQLRSCQTRTLSLPETGEVVTIDLGEVDIHPKDKIPVGERLALLARNKVYNEDIICQGPRYKSYEVQSDGKVILQFDNIGSGLLAKNSSDGSLNGFAIATANGTMVWANAKIEGNTVIVWNSTITEPAYLSYAWQYNPQNLNLYNEENLPAAPFKISLFHQGFTIKAFESTSKEIERGQFAVLSWEVYGASMVTVNGEVVDSIAGKRVVPNQTADYILEITDRLNPESTKSSKITIEVVDPKPTIALRTDVGGVAEPNTEITITADANPPKDGSITKVEFLVDGVSIAALAEAPYEIKWTTPNEIGTYEITGIVTDNKGYAVTSTPVSVYVTKLSMQIYEAEEASFTGTGSIKSSNLASNKKYVDLQSGWVLTFDKVEVPKAGTYPMTIRYLLNYEGPKAQSLIVNGKNLGEITFTASNSSTWMSYMLDVELNKGINKIEFDDSWGWMSFDYIAIAVEDTSTTPNSNKVLKEQLFNCYPNPFNNSTKISYQVDKNQKVQLVLYNSAGQKISTLVDDEIQKGNHTIELKANTLNPGIYFAKLMLDESIQTQKLLLIR